MKFNVIFVGGLSNGYLALKYIINSNLINVNLIVTHPKKYFYHELKSYLL